MSASTPPSPPVTSTVITVTGRHSLTHDTVALSPTPSLEATVTQASRRTSATSNHATKSGNESPEVFLDPKSVVANTHIIRVSGPVTNLDDAPATLYPRERTTSEVEQQQHHLQQHHLHLHQQHQQRYQNRMAAPETGGSTTSTSSSPLSTSPTPSTTSSTLLPSSKFVQTSV